MNKITRSILLSSLILVSSLAMAENNVIAQAKKAGVKRCLPAVGAISNYLVGTDPHGVDSFRTAKPDQQPFSATIERNAADGVALSSVTVTPLKDGDCALNYDQINWYNAACLVVAQELYPKHRYRGVLSKKVILLEGAATVYLLPAGEGCLALKKEVIVNANGLAGTAKKKEATKKDTQSGVTLPWTQ